MMSLCGNEDGLVCTGLYRRLVFPSAGAVQ
jgi:hypothetical protein